MEAYEHYKCCYNANHMHSFPHPQQYYFEVITF